MRKQNWRVFFRCCPHTLPQPQSLLPGNKLDTGISLTGVRSRGYGRTRHRLACLFADVTPTTTTLPARASAAILTPNSGPVLVPLAHLQPQQCHPPSRCCMIKSSYDSSGLLSRCRGLLIAAASAWPPVSVPCPPPPGWLSWLACRQNEAFPSIRPAVKHMTGGKVVSRACKHRGHIQIERVGRFLSKL